MKQLQKQMECPNCHENTAYWVHGTNIALYSCDSCKHEYHVDLDSWDKDEHESGENKGGLEYIVDRPEHR